jgi:hypothetical protein
MVIKQILGVVFGTALLVTQGASAQSPVVTGDYSIFYNTLTSVTLDPEIAAKHGIQRSKLNGLLNVTVVRGQAEGKRQNVPARVEATARTGDAPATSLAMREIRVGDGVSYIGQFPIQNLQIIDFTIQVTPPGAGEPTVIELQEQFFTD